MLQSQADTLDSALVGIESLPAQVQSQAAQFVAEHQPNTMYSVKLTELGETNTAMKPADAHRRDGQR